MSKKWIIYILCLSDDTFYTGITKDLCRRLQQHSSGKGSKYVRGRLPIKYIAYIEYASTRSKASRREWEIKKLKREKKIEMVKEYHLSVWGSEECD